MTIRASPVLGLLLLLVVQACGSTVQVDESICITDPKQKAQLEALNAACKETGADPIEIIRLGLETLRQQTNQQKAKATEIVRPEFDYYGLNSLFNEEDQAKQEDEEEEGYSLGYLFDESNHSSGSRVHHQTEQRVNKSSSMFEENLEDYYGLNRLYSEDWTARSSKRNPMDDATDFGLKSLFGEPTGEQTLPPAERAPLHRSKILDTEFVPVDKVQSQYGKPNVPAIEIPPNKMDENRKLPQFDSLFDMYDQDQEDYEDGDYDQDSLFEVPTPGESSRELEKKEKPSKLNTQVPSEAAKPISGQNETAPNSKPALENIQPSASSKSDGVENKPTHGENSASFEIKPAERDAARSVDTHIDVSVPSDPNKVHIDRRTESSVDPTGAVNHVDEETRTSSSVSGDNSSKQHYSRRSSHSSTSYSSSFASPNNGRPRKNNNHRNKNRNKNKKQMQSKPAAYPAAIPPLPPMVLPVIPMMPYNPSQPAWPNFYNPTVGRVMSNRQMKRLQHQQQHQYPYAPAYAGAQAGPSGSIATAYAGPAGAYASSAGAYAGSAGAYAGPAGAYAGSAAPYPYWPTGNQNNNRRGPKNTGRKAKQQAEQQHTAAKQQY